MLRDAIDRGHSMLWQIDLYLCGATVRQCLFLCTALLIADLIPDGCIGMPHTQKVGQLGIVHEGGTF
jgi:hypothetical protein